MRFQISAADIVDNNTSLVWKIPTNVPMTYSEAVAYVEETNEETGVEWRIPTPMELMSLVDHSIANPATTFPSFLGSQDTLTYRFWTSVPCVAFPDQNWIVNLTYGELGIALRVSACPVLLVRD
jgi:hypothetical protein